MKVINSAVVPDIFSTYLLESQRDLARGASSKIKKNERRKQRHALRSELPSLIECIDEYHAHLMMEKQSKRALKIVRTIKQKSQVSVPMKSVNVLVFRKQSRRSVTSEMLSMNIPQLAA